MWLTSQIKVVVIVVEIVVVLVVVVVVVVVAVVDLEMRGRCKLADFRSGRQVQLNRVTSVDESHPTVSRLEGHWVARRHSSKRESSSTV